jgi:hypothetical protein
MRAADVAEAMLQDVASAPMPNHSYQPKEIVMLRTSNILAIVLSVAAIGSATVPAAAYTEEVVRGPVKIEHQGCQWSNCRPRVVESDKLPRSSKTMHDAEMPIHLPNKNKD